MTSQLRHFFQASQAVHGADDITTLPVQFSEGLWSPSLYYYLLQQAGVPNLIQLISVRADSKRLKIQPKSGLQNKWEFIFPFSFQETFEFFVLHHLLPGQARHQVQVLQGRNRKWRRRHQPHRRMPGLREGDAVQGKVPAAGSEAG